ncbi:MAG: RNA polymerase-binding protein DksA [Tepidiphilus sp.]|nr:RNA polymerase-binding protein DksA [Tepidiphilus sp.]MDD3434245.1 RNA polymerase-binding protein DksA [Tepidiphilus sp.]
MPEEEYMSPRQLKFFKHLLLEEKRRLLEKAAETTQSLQQENEVTPDWTDRATIEEEQALELRVRDRERKLMKKIDEALERIEKGTYGWCEETGEPIGLKRLLARPTATLCLEAQERHERLEKLQGG